MAIDFSRANVDDDVGQIEGFTELAESRIVPPLWNDPRAATVGYWRCRDDRMPRGRITLLQYGRNAVERQDRESDYEQLRRYGQYKPNDKAGAWQPWRDPFLAIVQRGGLKEFDAYQLVELGWHRRPGRNAYQSHREVWRLIEAEQARGLDEREAVRAVLPQLAEHEFADVPCELCPGKTFSALSQAAAVALKHRHDSIVHKEEVRSRETREAIAAAISESGSQNADTQQLLATILDRLTTILTPEPARRGRSARDVGDG